MQYLALLSHIRQNGIDRPDRTGVGTRSIFGAQMRFDLSEGFPIVTTKRVNFKAVVHELLWFLAGDTNITYLNDNGVHIWDEWADENGDLGPVYGAQWRSWPTRSGEPIDQIQNVIKSIRKNPTSRRHIVTAWNPEEVNEMALPPCHLLFQFYVADGKLSCHLIQRSLDCFLGCPFNQASYSLLTHMIAHVTGLEPGEFIHTVSDAHIYHNHFEQVDRQLSRKPYERPVLWLDECVQSIDEYTFDSIALEGYKCHPAIRAPIAV